MAKETDYATAIYIYIAKPKMLRKERVWWGPSANRVNFSNGKLMMMMMINMKGDRKSGVVVMVIKRERNDLGTHRP